jgi:hypothetical protein
MQVKNKLYANTDYYPTKDNYIFFVFNYTIRDIQIYLAPWYNKDLAL